jgi:hypothetical protein
MSSSGIREITTLLGGKFCWFQDRYVILYEEIIGNREIGISLVLSGKPVPLTVEDFYEILRSLDPKFTYLSEEICFENESEDAKKEFENFFCEFKQYYSFWEETFQESVTCIKRDKDKRFRDEEEEDEDDKRDGKRIKIDESLNEHCEIFY